MVNSTINSTIIPAIEPTPSPPAASPGAAATGGDDVMKGLQRALQVEQVNQIITPEAVQLNLPAAGVPSRALARLFDVFVLMSLMMPLAFVASLISSASATLGTYVGSGGVLVLIVGYPVFFEVLVRGRTPGKAIVGLRVVTSRGGPIRLKHAAIRSLTGLFEVFATFGSVAVISAFFSDRFQRLGDLAAGTFVINERSGERRSGPVVFPCPVGWEEYVFSLDVSRLTDQQYGIIRATLIRSAALEEKHRFTLMSALGSQVVNQLQVSVPDNSNPQTFLVCVCCAYQRRNGGLAAVGWERYGDVAYVAPEAAPSIAAFAPGAPAIVSTPPTA